MRSTIAGRPGARCASARREGVIRRDGECGMRAGVRRAHPCRARPPRDRPGRDRRLRRAARRGRRPGRHRRRAAAGLPHADADARAAARPSLPPVRSKVQLTRLACASGCGADGAVRPGALLRVRGTSMRRAAEVHFDGATGDADDVAAAPVSAARPPSTCACRSAPPPAPSRCSTATACSPRPRPRRWPSSSRRPRCPPPAARRSTSTCRPRRRTSTPRGRCASPTSSTTTAPVNVRVELVRVSRPGRDRELGARRGAARDAAARAVERHGRRARAEAGPLRLPRQRRRRGGRAARLERPGAADDAPAARARPGRRSRFLRHTFPVLGPHGYGEFAAKFGGGRGHQGQDVFAACGTPMVAARGGIVKFKQYHSRAGYYLVIDGERTGHRLRLHAPALGRARGQGRARAHRPADRLRRRHGRRQRLPPALRDVERAGLVQRRRRRSTRCPDLLAWDKSS